MPDPTVPAPEGVAALRHTPGPWKAHDWLVWGPNTLYCRIRPEGLPDDHTTAIAYVWCQQARASAGQSPSQEAAANARLVAAAPALLAACVKALGHGILDANVIRTLQDAVRLVDGE